jgi:hypothetical protein
VPHEQLEQVELLAGDVERPAGEGHRAGGPVEVQVAEGQRLVARLFRRGAGSPQDRAHARDDLPGAERLDDVVVGAELEADDAVGLVAAGGEHDDRHLRGAADLTADVEARSVGQHQIEQDEVGLDARGRIERLCDGARDAQVEPLTLQ